MQYGTQILMLHQLLIKHMSSAHLGKIFGCNCNFLNIAPAQEIPNVTKDDQYAIRNVGNNGNQQGSFLK